MKHLCISFLFATFLLAGGCTKSSSPTPGPTPTPATSPYYFKFTMDGVSYDLKSAEPQYMPFYANGAGGYEVAAGALYPSAGLRFMWPLDDTVTESDIMGLKGKTLYYNDTFIRPELSFTKLPTLGMWYSEDTANTSYNIKITNVTFLKKDTTASVPVKTYVITGTCNGVLSDGTSTGIFSAGTFNFVVSRQDL